MPYLTGLRKQQKVQNPLEKEGAVGLFNRAFFPISKALSEFLSDVYEPTDNKNRWHLITAHSMAGVEIKEDMFVYSHHAKDPAYLKLCNAFDIVRIHKFGGLDDKASYREMCKFAMSLDAVKLLAAEERLAEAVSDFSAPVDDDWKKRLRRNKDGVLENCLHNIRHELQHAIDRHSRTLIVSNIEMFLNYCVRFYDRQFITRSDVAGKDILARFERTLDDYFLSDKPQTEGLPTVQYCAQELHLSANYFGDLVKRLTGKTAQEHIRLRLIDAAKERIADPARSIAEVAYELGFKYPAHFTRLFKNVVGCTPNRYRSRFD